MRDSVTCRGIAAFSASRTHWTADNAAVAVLNCHCRKRARARTPPEHRVGGGARSRSEVITESRIRGAPPSPDTLRRAPGGTRGGRANVARRGAAVSPRTNATSPHSRPSSLGFPPLTVRQLLSYNSRGRARVTIRLAGTSCNRTVPLDYVFTRRDKPRTEP